MSRVKGDTARRWPGAPALGAIVVMAAVVAWFVGGALVRRAQADRLPTPPDLTGVSEAVRGHILEADATARAHPASATAVGDLAMAYHASLLIPHALLLYAEAERLAPDDWRWLYYRGLLREERGEQDAAVEAFTRVTAANSAAGLAWFRLGEIAFKQGRADSARQAYARAKAAPAAAPFSTPGGVIGKRLPSQSTPTLAWPGSRRTILPRRRSLTVPTCRRPMRYSMP